MPEVVQPESNSVPKPEAKIPPLDSKEKEPQRHELLIPRIEDYPTKARIWVIDAHAAAVPQFQKAERIVDGLNTFVQAMEANVEAGKARVEKAAIPTPDMLKIADDRLAKAQAELDLLCKVHKRLSKGKDATDLLLTNSQITGEDLLAPHQRIFFEKNQERGFKFRQKLRPIFKNPQHEAHLKQSLQQQRHEFGIRTRDLVSALLDPIHQTVPQTSIEPITLDDFAGKTEAQIQERVRNVTGKFWTDFEEATKNGASGGIYKEKLKDWITKSSKQLEQVHALGSLELQMVPQEQYFENNKRQLLQSIDFYPKAAIKHVINSTWAIACGSLEAGRQAYKRTKHGEKSSFMLDEWVPREAVQIARNLNPKIQASIETGKRYQAKWDNFNYTFETTTQSIEGDGKIRSERNRDFPKDQELFYHVAPYKIMKQVITRGELASRKVQEDTYGESYFHSGGRIKTTKDTVTHVDTSGNTQIVPKSKYETVYSLGRGKDPDQEAYQICFSPDGPYHYQDGVALVFSKTSLCSQSQFFDQDGWHFFDKDWASAPDSPGFKVKLDKEPHMLIAVTGQRAEDFKTFLKTLGTKTDEWIENNVVIVPSTADGKFDVDEDKMREIFFTKNRVAIRQGMFVPTGEVGDHAGRTTDFLYTYKT